MRWSAVLSRRICVTNSQSRPQGEPELAGNDSGELGLPRHGAGADSDRGKRYCHRQVPIRDSLSLPEEASLVRAMEASQRLTHGLDAAR